MLSGIGVKSTIDSTMACPRASTPTRYSGAGKIHISLLRMPLTTSRPTVSGSCGRAHSGATSAPDAGAAGRAAGGAGAAAEVAAAAGTVFRYDSGLYVG